MNYVFPDLANYKCEWIPVLAAARKRIESEDCMFLCQALYVEECTFLGQALYMCDEAHQGECSSAYVETYRKAAKAVGANISAAIYGYGTVIKWLHDTHHIEVSDVRDYRLAWINHIIKECQKCQNP